MRHTLEEVYELPIPMILFVKNHTFNVFNFFYI